MASGGAVAMVEDDEKEFLSYAKHCEDMAAASTSEDDRALWLRMAAAWRRECIRTPD